MGVHLENIRTIIALPTSKSAFHYHHTLTILNNISDKNTVPTGQTTATTSLLYPTELII